LHTPLQQSPLVWQLAPVPRSVQQKPEPRPVKQVPLQQSAEVAQAFAEPPIEPEAAAGAHPQWLFPLQKLSQHCADAVQNCPVPTHDPPELLPLDPLPDPELLDPELDPELPLPDPEPLPELPELEPPAPGLRQSSGLVSPGSQGPEGTHTQMPVLGQPDSAQQIVF